MDVSRSDSIFSEDDKGDIVFSDDVKDPAVIKGFVEAAGDVDYVPIPEEGEGPYPKESEQETGLTLLHWAAWYKQVETIKILLQYGANVEAKDFKGKTPLDLAKQQKAEKGVVDLLSSRNKRASLRV
jgi:ankyrin repeat protein